MVEDFIAEYGGAPRLPGQSPKPAEAETTIDT
jgi:hypothetical protein